MSKKGKNVDNVEILDICIDSLTWAKKQDYKGYSKFDALNSKPLMSISKKSKLLRSIFVFGLSRSLINIRALLLVHKKINPKGIALFIRSYLNLYEITKDKVFLDEAKSLLDVLINLSKKEKYSGHSWGYDHPWQNKDFFILPYEPNTVVTCFVGEAFLHAYEVLKDPFYLNVCKSISEFLFNDLNYIFVGQDKLCCSYDLKSSWKVINVNALVSAFLAKLYKYDENDDYKDRSKSHMNWVVSLKTEDHAWYYTDPPNDSRITIDNYHTGFILDTILDFYRVFPDNVFGEIYLNGLEYYKKNLFTKDFAPKWMYNKVYPYDIHGAAQSVITFARSFVINEEYLKFSENVLNWTLINLYNPKNNTFWYQKGKFFTKKFTLMRWCQAWMCYAISVFLKMRNQINE